MSSATKKSFDKFVKPAKAQNPGKNGSNGSSGLKGGLAGGNDPHNALREAAEKVALTTKPPELRLPPTSRPDMTAIELLEIQEQEAMQRDEEIAARVGEWMGAESLPFLDKVRKKLQTLGKKVLDLVAGKDEAGKVVTFGQQRDEYQRLNADYLLAAFQIGETEKGEPFLLPALKTRREAHMAVLKHRLLPEMDKGQFLDVINQCEEDGYFIEDTGGYINVWQRHYMLSDSEKFGGLGEDQERLLAEIVGHHINRISEAFKEDVQNIVDKLKKQATIELPQLLAGEPGKCLIHAPAEMHGSFRVSEVYILVEGNGEGKVFVRDAAGSGRDRVLDIMGHKIYLSLQHMEIPRPPKVETMMERWNFSEGSARDYQHLWGCLNRAKMEQEAKEKRLRDKDVSDQAEKDLKEAWAKAQAQAQALKDEYAREATISLDRVLLESPPMEGIFFAEFDKDWKNPKGDVLKGLLFFQGELVVKNGKPFLRVRKAPEHLVDKFFTETSTEFTPYEGMFQGLDQPLQGLMKALYTQIKRKVVSA